MIISALSNYYDILAQDENSEIALNGFCRVQASFEFVINTNGILMGILPLEDTFNDGKKEKRIAKSLIVPQQEKKSSGIISNFLCENPGYVIGLYNPKEEKNKNEKKIEESKAKAQKRFESFKELHNQILKRTDNRYAKIFLKYLNEYDNERYKDIIDPMQEELLRTTGQIVFNVDGCYLHRIDEIKTVWISYLNEKIEKSIKMQCAISGDYTAIANLHPSIKGVWGAQSSGASIVSFNSNSYESYGKTQGINAPISEEITFKYTTALNHLLSSKDNRIQIGDATTVFWADSPKKDYTDFLSFLLNPPCDVKNDGKNEEEKEEENEVKSENSVVAKETENKVKALLNAFKVGSRVDFAAYDLDKDIKTYILGLSPNASRLSVRFYYADSFLSIIEKIINHYQDLSIEKNYDNQPDSIPTWLLIRETTNPNSRKSVNPLLAGSLTRSIITGEMYPKLLYNTIINRIRCDRDINYIRAASIKGFLLRYSRIYNKEKIKEVLSMSLNETTNNTAYLLGRLFSVLEKAQKDANPGINATIKDRYFSSACATPASVFPTLLKLAQNHISKSDYGYTYDKRISDILNMLDDISLPTHLTLEDQGIFIIGYYQQNNAFYKRAEQKEIKEEEKGDKK